MLRKIAGGLRSLFLKERVERELDEELRDFLEMAIQEKMKQGMCREDALRAVRWERGHLEGAKETVRAAGWESFVETCWQDLRFSLRMFRRNPAFAATAILTLALGIGATTAIFSVVDAVMLKPLPFPRADRLVRIESVISATGGGSEASYPDFLDWRAQNQVFEGMGVSRTQDFTLVGPREPVHLQGAEVSAQLFSLLGANPILGRSFLPEEDNPAAINGTDPIILSYGLWQRAFGSEPSVLGRTIQLGAQQFTQQFTVVGVMPQSFEFPIQVEPTELWTTIAIDAYGGSNAMTANRGAHYLDVNGVLKEGVTLKQGQAEMVGITSALNRQHPEVKPRTVRIVPELQALAGPARTPLLMLLGAVGCVLLIVCANVANLLLARATARNREMAIRSALGATRWHLTCQLLTESMALALLGGGVGLALSVELLRLLVRLLPAKAPRLNAIGLDSRLLTFALLISLLVGLLFGLAPALRGSKIGFLPSLKGGGQDTDGEGKGQSRLRKALVVSEIALAAVLLPAAGLFIQSFVHLARVDLGFDPHHVLTFQLDAPAGKEGAQAFGFFRDVVSQIGTLPGVSSASVATSLPLMGHSRRSSVEIEGQPTPTGSRPSADFNAIAPNYFHTVGTTIVAGRDFTEHDDSSAVPVVIVNRMLARRFFPNQDPIGKHIRPGIGNGYGPGEPPMREIVGVIADVKQGNPGAEATAEVYAPLAQSPFGTVFVMARCAIDPQKIAAPARRAIASLDSHVPLYHVETLDQYFVQWLALPRFITLLLSGFASLALLLASVGVYGVMSYTVVRRTHEIGVRMALGAKRSDVLKLIVRQGSMPTMIGLAIGVTGCLAITRFFSTLLYGIQPTDPLTFFVVSLILAVVALIASYIPAHRAASVDPMVALRYE